MKPLITSLLYIFLASPATAAPLYGSLRPLKKLCGETIPDRHQNKILEVCLVENSEGPTEISQYLIIKDVNETQTYFLGGVSLVETNPAGSRSVILTSQPILSVFEAFSAYGTLYTRYSNSQSFQSQTPFNISGVLPTGEEFSTLPLKLEN